MGLGDSWLSLLRVGPYPPAPFPVRGEGEDSRRPKGFAFGIQQAAPAGFFGGWPPDPPLIVPKGMAVVCYNIVCYTMYSICVIIYYKLLRF